MKLIKKCPRNSVEAPGNQIVLPLGEVTSIIGDIVLWASGQGITTYTSQKIIVWNGSLDLQLSIKIIDALRAAARKDTDPIWLIIDSTGGDIGAAFDIIAEMDKIKANKIKVITVNNGNADSAAGLVAVSGSRRYMKMDSSFFVHKPWYYTNDLAEKIKTQGVTHPTFCLGGQVLDIVEDYKNVLHFWTVELVRHLTANSRMSEDFIYRLLESNNGEGTGVEMQEAEQYGFCDEGFYGIDYHQHDYE